jgi:hypothetical protein
MEIDFSKADDDQQHRTSFTLPIYRRCWLNIEVMSEEHDHVNEEAS